MITRGYLCCALVYLLAAPSTARSQIENRYNGCKLDLEIQEKFPTKVPVTFSCRIENQSEKYWGIRPFSPYMMAYGFFVEIAGGEAKPRRVTATNGIGPVYVSARYVPMKPGESKLVPLAIDPLPAGKYLLILEKKHSAPFEVVDDKALREKVLKGFMDGFWSGDIFSKDVLSKLPTDDASGAAFRTVEEEMYAALRSGDQKKSISALDFLSAYPSMCRAELLEKNLVESVEARIKKKSDRAPGAWDKFFSKSAALAARIPSDKTFAVVMQILKDAEAGNSGRANLQVGVVTALRDFKQQKAADELFSFADRSPTNAFAPMVVYEAAHALCFRKDPRALGVLFKLYHDDEFRAYKGKLLLSATCLYDNPGVDELIRIAANDPDPLVRGDAAAAAARLKLKRDEPRERVPVPKR